MFVENIECHIYLKKYCFVKTEKGIQMSSFDANYALWGLASFLKLFSK